MRRSGRRKASTGGKVRIGYELDARLMHQFRILAAEKDEPHTILLEDAIRDYLAKHGKTVPPSKPRHT